MPTKVLIASLGLEGEGNEQSIQIFNGIRFDRMHAFIVDQHIICSTIGYSRILGREKTANNNTVTTGATSSGTAVDEDVITVSNIQKNNVFGGFKFDTDKAVTAADLAGKFKAGTITVAQFQERSEADGKSWKAVVEGCIAGQTYTITCESPFKIIGNNVLSWDKGPAPKVTDIDAKENNGIIDVTFSAPAGQKQMIDSYRVMAVKNGSPDTSGSKGQRVEMSEASQYTVSLNEDMNGNELVNGTYTVYVLSVANTDNASGNTLSSGKQVTLTGCGGGDSGDGGTLPAPAAPVFQGAAVTTAGSISVAFDKQMADPAGKYAGFTVNVNGSADSVTGAALSNDATIIVLTLTTPVTAGQTVTVAYTKGADAGTQIMAADGGVLESFAAQPVTNNLTPPAPAAPLLLSTEVTTQGDVGLTFDKAIDGSSLTNVSGQFTVKVAGSDDAVNSVQTTNTAGKIKLVLGRKITAGQTVTVAYTKGSSETTQVRALDGGILESIAEQSVTNNLQ